MNRYREAAIRSWKDPEVRQRRIDAIRATGKAKREKTVTLKQLRVSLAVDPTLIDELNTMAKAKSCTRASLVRAYIEAGLYADQHRLERSNEPT